MNYEEIEWSQFYNFSTNQPHLPRVLLIGDSIVVGEREIMAEKLAGEMTVSAFSSSRIVGDPTYLQELRLAFADFQPDLIVFNNGLHGRNYDNDFYREGLTKALEYLLQQTTAPILWRNSTPVTVIDDTTKLDAVNDLVIARNEIAAQVMAEHNIPVLDMYSLIVNRPELRSKDGFHYLPEGYQVQACFLVEEIRKAMARVFPEHTIGGLRTNWPGKVSYWNGVRRHDFTINGVNAVLLEPNGTPADGNPWYWRMHWFGAFPTADLELLKRGWTVANIHVYGLYGGPEAQRRMDDLYAFMVAMGYAKKTIAVGFSRGGLDAWPWVARHTDAVAAMYLDNAVCSIQGWPCRKDTDAYASEVKICLEVLNLTPETMDDYRGNPIDEEILKPVADAGIPVLSVVSDADTVVLPEENTMKLVPIFERLGGKMEIIHKPGIDHHPHSLSDPTPIVDFVLKAFKERQ